jgi:succinyl-diaminopimelate desuccinylase
MSTLENITRIATDLIRFQSTREYPEICTAVAEYVLSLLEDTSWNVHHIIHNNVHSLIICNKPDASDLSFDLLFLGHIDVVPATTQESFTPTIDGDRLYGRGSADMKGSVATMLQLFIDNQSHNSLSNAALILTTDEESGGRDGIGHLVGDLGLIAKTVVNPDGGHAFVPCTQHKGISQYLVEEQSYAAFGDATDVLSVEFSLGGKGAHGSRPYLGKSAIFAAVTLRRDICRVLTDFDLTEANFAKISGGLAVNLVPVECKGELQIPLSDTSIGEALTKRLLSLEGVSKVSHQSQVKTVPADNAIETLLSGILKLKERFSVATADDPMNMSLNFGIVLGTAERAEISIDCRYPKIDDDKLVEESARQIFNHAKVTQIASGYPLQVAPGDPALELFLDVMKERAKELTPYGYTGKTSRSTGSSDARYFTPQQSSVILIKPFSSEFHADNEWASLGSLDAMYRVFETFAYRHGEVISVRPKTESDRSGSFTPTKDSASL